MSGRRWKGAGGEKKGSLFVGVKNRQNNLTRNFVTCITKCYFPLYPCKHFIFSISRQCNNGNYDIPELQKC
jgi:hypothetical protein